jgi:hypothetical protein
MRGALRRRVFGFGASALLMAACTYDFDGYVEDGTGGVASTSGGAGGTTGGVGDAGAAVTPEGGTTGGVSARGGSAGAQDSGGEGGSSGSGAAGETGAEAGAAGAAQGGSGSGGATSGGGTSGDGGTSGGSNGGSSTAGEGGAEPDCEALNGTVFDGHCYFYVGSLLDFEAARSQCAGASATLVAINSEEEQRFLESTFFAPARDAWIGLSLADLGDPNAASCEATPSSCPFRWLTDEPLSFTKWGNHGGSDQEPNYTGACVRIQSDTLDWADQGCTERVRAICERD